MAKGKKAVYYICDDKNWGHVSFIVWDILKEEGYLNPAGFTFDGREVMKYIDEKKMNIILLPAILPYAVIIPDFCLI